MSVPPALAKYFGTYFDSDLVNIADQADVMRAAEEVGSSISPKARGLRKDRRVGTPGDVMRIPNALQKVLGTHFDSDLVNVSDKDDVLRAASEASFFLTSDSATVEEMTDVATYLRAFLCDLPETELSKLERITNAEWSDYLPNLTAAFAHMLSNVESKLRARAKS